MSSNMKSVPDLIYKMDPAKFHLDPIWKDGTLGFTWRGSPKKQKKKNDNNNNNNKMSSDTSSWSLKNKMDPQSSQRQRVVNAATIWHFD